MQINLTHKMAQQIYGKKTIQCDEIKDFQIICSVAKAEKVATRLCNSIFSAVCIYNDIYVCACTCDVRATKRNARE